MSTELHCIATELVYRLANHIVHLVRRAGSISVVITLEQMARQVSRSERATWFVQRGTCPMNRLCNQTLLDGGHHRVRLNGFNLLLSEHVLCLLLRRHHLARIGRIFAAF